MVFACGYAELDLGQLAVGPHVGGSVSLDDRTSVLFAAPGAVLHSSVGGVIPLPTFDTDPEPIRLPCMTEGLDYFESRGLR